ncbi:MAG TPA: DUF4142 domain-containing protein [Pilimelia sp.]|nr:DUF4142 domain-containing protein [Pilimelia sp.]
MTVLAALGLAGAIVPLWKYTLASAPRQEAAQQGAPLPAAASPGHTSHPAGGKAAGQAAPTQGSGGGGGSVNVRTGTPSGPVSALDREFLVRVRLANLWELPSGRLAQANAGSEQVRRAGLHLIDGHSRLDQIVRETAGALDVDIPDQPNAEQAAILRQLRDSRGEEFDRIFANQLRIAHGKVFPIVAQVRSSTQNNLIRDLAVETNLAVSDHLQVLEDTGLVERKTFETVEEAVTK